MKESKLNKGEYISISDAAALFEVSPSTIARDIVKYRLRSYKDGRNRMVHRKELKAIFKPVMHFGDKVSFTVIQEAIFNRTKLRINIAVECSGLINPLTKKPYRVSKEFFKDDTRRQAKWKKHQQKIFDKNQSMFKTNKASEDWGVISFFELS